MNEPTCPRCHQPLRFAGDETRVLRCEQCAGLFVPQVSGQQDFFAEPADAHPGTTRADPCADPTAESRLRCPGCGTPMQRMSIEEAEVDHCPACGGRWLDAGDLPSGGPTDAPPILSTQLLYCLTLPERALRSGVGLAAGTAREAAKLLVPQAFQSCRTYEVVVANSLRFLAEDIGGAEGDTAADDPRSDDYLARKAVGNFVDMAGLATLHVSPLWLLAIISDVAYGSKSYLNELAAELKKQGLIDDTSTIRRVDDVLEAIRGSSGHALELFDSPPLSVEQLKETLDNTRASLISADYRQIVPEAELARYWNDMREIAARENVSLVGVSGALTMHSLGRLGAVSQGALTGVRVAGGLLNRHVVGHYAESLRTTRERGFYQTLRESSAPYVAAVWKNFASDRQTWTEQLVTGQALAKGWQAVSGWFGRNKQPSQPPTTAHGESGSLEEKPPS